ncbi:hypothetical protein B0H19DRAFT_1253123 [Mycena capillaripes]|nr:hypothetical protein B0H19DRAFT_1253123 [Mycena capillaripes]
MPLEDRGVHANIDVLPPATPEEALLMVNVRTSFTNTVAFLSTPVLVILFINIDLDRRTAIAYVYKLFFGMGDQISGMYPTIIIVIVNLQMIWDPPSTSAADLGTINGVVTSIQWANSETKKS